MKQLCFIKGNFAYFTENLERQSGPNWEEPSYEHNAGEPTELQDSELEVLAFRSNAETPAERYAPDSKLSVKQINQRDTPWLSGGLWTGISVYAGCSIDTFVEELEKDGGEVFRRVSSTVS